MYIYMSKRQQNLLLEVNLEFSISRFPFSQ